MFNTLKLLIEKHYYKTKAEISEKVDVFYSMSKITTEEYVELTMLIEEKYPEEQEEPTEEAE